MASLDEKIDILIAKQDKMQGQLDSVVEKQDKMQGQLDSVVEKQDRMQGQLASVIETQYIMLDDIHDLKENQKIMQKDFALLEQKVDNNYAKLEKHDRDISRKLDKAVDEICGTIFEMSTYLPEKRHKQLFQ